MSYPLENLVIHRFRGLRDLQLTGLGRVNLLVGVNNSGKTSVLEALLAYASPLNLGAWVRAARSREDSFAGASALEALSWLFPRAASGDLSAPYNGENRIDSTGTYSVRAMTAAFHELQEFGVSLPLFDPESPAEEDELAGAGLRGEIVRRGAELSVTVAATANQEHPGSNGSGHTGPMLQETFQIWEGQGNLARRPANGPALPVRMLAPYGHRFQPPPVEQFTELRMEGMNDAVVQLARGMDPSIRGIEILVPHSGAASLYIDHAHVGLAPLNAFGDGLRRSLAIALSLPTLRHGVLLVDEIESSIHVSALPQVFSWLVKSCQQLDVQLFATTHSLEAVDALLGVEAKSLDEVVAYRLEGTNGASSVRRFSGDLLHRLRYERGLDVR